MINCSVIIIHYKNISETENTVLSLKSLATENLSIKVILVNNSTEDISFLDKKTNSPLVVINNTKNLGFAEGCNIGIKEAQKNNSQYVLFLNSDTLVSKELLLKLIESCKSKKIGIVSPKIYFAKGYEFHTERYKKNEQGSVLWYAGGKIDWGNVYASHRGVDEVDHGQYQIQEETDFATGCCMLVNIEVFNTIGLFDPKYFVYFEDVDLSIRAKRAGFDVLYVPNAHMWHKNALSSDKPGSPIHVYFQTRNRYYFALKYAPFKTKLHILKELAINIYSKDKNIKNAARDALFGKMDKGSFENL